MDGWSTDDSMTGDDNRGGPVPADGAQPGSWSSQPAVPDHDVRGVHPLLPLPRDARHRHRHAPKGGAAGGARLPHRRLRRLPGPRRPPRSRRVEVPDPQPGALEARRRRRHEFVLPKSENKHVIIPYTDVPGVDHKFALTLYARPRRASRRSTANKCHITVHLFNGPSGMARVLSKLRRRGEAQGAGRENARCGCAAASPTRQGSSVGAYAGGGVPAPGSSNFMWPPTPTTTASSTAASSPTSSGSRRSSRVPTATATASSRRPSWPTTPKACRSTPRRAQLHARRGAAGGAGEERRVAAPARGGEGRRRGHRRGQGQELEPLFGHVSGARARQ